MTDFQIFSKNKIAVVGMGYIGSILFNVLKQKSKQHNFTIISYSRKNICDIKDEEFDYIFNCAGNTGDFRQKIFETIESNIFLTRFLLENVKINKAYVALSSTRLYGFSINEDCLFEENEVPFDLKKHLDIDFIYDGSKKLLESLLWNIKDQLPYKIIVCRLSNLFGRFEKSDLDDSTFLKLMIRHKIEHKNLAINQNINNTKGYVFIDDAIDGIIKSAINSIGHNIYNICSGQSYSIMDWINYLGIQFHVTNINATPTYSKNDISKAQKELGFAPKHFLQNIKLSDIININ